MKSKLLLGIGIAAGYVLGSRSGRAAYDKLKTRAAGIWDSKPVQDKVNAATQAIKEKAPDVADQLGETARRASTVIGSAMHRDSAANNGNAKTSDVGASTGAPGTAGNHAPAHSTHPETVNLGTSDVESDPALNDAHGQDWSDEGGATPAGAATNVDPRRE
ncbi:MULTISPECIES: YtxH domain-containing protein [unclassified Arthrobacter]|uniref:YtxH domain-containing protein n=1 Tax=unclassified Arthrobacter TaxID=235627 RepID=UPI00339B0CCF